MRATESGTRDSRNSSDSPKWNPLGGSRTRSHSPATKKWARSRRNGPPIVKPPWAVESSGTVATSSTTSSPTSASLR